MKLLAQRKYLLLWISSVAIVTILCGLVYGTVQQSLRQSANDPQIQLAEDIASQILAGQKISQYENPGKVDLAKSLATFLIIYDDKGQPIAGNAQLDSKIPVVPLGVLESAGKSGQNRVTWQPQPSVRIASVVVPFTGSQNGYVLVGRSLREVEIRENFVFKAVLAAWLLSILIISSILFIIHRFKSTSQS